MNNKKYYEIVLWSLVFVASSMIIGKILLDWNGFLGFLSYIFKITSPFLWGFSLAFLLNPVVKWFMRKVFIPLHKKLVKNSDKPSKWPFYWSLVVVYILVVGLITGILFIIIPQIYDSLVELIGLLNVQYFKIVDWLNHLPETIHGVNVSWIVSVVQDAAPRVVEYATTFTANLLPIIANKSLLVIRGIWNIILGFIISAYVLGDKTAMLEGAKRFFYAYLPIKRSGFIFKLSREANVIFSNYITGKTLDSMIIGILCFVFMSILKLDFAVLISVTFAITNMIPYFGPLIGVAFGTFILLIKSPLSGLIFLIMGFILQQFDGLYLGPKILGQSTGIKPFWVIFAITLGGSLFGVIGMLIGVPAVAVLLYGYNILLEERMLEREITFDLNGSAKEIKKRER